MGTYPQLPKECNACTNAAGCTACCKWCIVYTLSISHRENRDPHGNFQRHATYGYFPSKPQASKNPAKNPAEPITKTQRNLLEKPTDWVQGCEVSRFHRSSQVFTSLHRLPQVFTGLHRSSQLFTGFHRFSSVFTGLHRCSQVFTGYTSCHGFSQVFTGLHRFSQVFTCLHRFSHVLKGHSKKFKTQRQPFKTQRRA